MKLFVWDFHGVLEKGTLLYSMSITNRVLKEKGYEVAMTEEECKKLFGLKWYEYFEYLLPEESHEKHIELQEACFAHDMNVTPEEMRKFISANDHSHDVLEKIKSNHSQILISNTKPQALKDFVSTVEMKAFFNDENAFAVDMHVKEAKKTKLDVLKEFLDGKSFDEIIIIGDSPSDMRLKEVSGGKTYLYTHQELPFRECESDYKIRDLREILKEI